MAGISRGNISRKKFRIPEELSKCLAGWKKYKEKLTDIFSIHSDLYINAPLDLVDNLVAAPDDAEGPKPAPVSALPSILVIRRSVREHIMPPLRALVYTMLRAKPDQVPKCPKTSARR